MSFNNNNNNNSNNNNGDAAADASALAALLAALTISPQRNAALVAALRALADSLENSSGGSPVVGYSNHSSHSRGASARSPPNYSSSSSVFLPSSNNDIGTKVPPAIPIGPSASMITVGGSGAGVAVSAGGGSSSGGGSNDASAGTVNPSPSSSNSTNNVPTDLYHVPDADETGTVYVITRGRDIGVFVGWDTVSPLVTGVSRAVYFTVDSVEEGHRRMARAIAAGTAVRV